MRLSFRPEVDRELDAAYAWYESRQPGLGESFFRSVDACLARIRRDPEMYAVQYGRVRRAPLHRFPYSIFYVVWTDCVDILAVYHSRRRPRRFEP